MENAVFAYKKSLGQLDVFETVTETVKDRAGLDVA
ncbi:hypothetical protein ABAC402_07085 [Asticcacaulis sp. AC402]|nr:hypothetical protein ABAC402_07085 [Asticcacaulis sp. AC402]